MPHLSPRIFRVSSKYSERWDHKYYTLLCNRNGVLEKLFRHGQKNEQWSLTMEFFSKYKAGKEKVGMGHQCVGFCSKASC